ncbi:MAG: DUF4160 domain-containing protein [Alcanivorax sp.]|nr:DUF4160 domain-containing protein [Alcanivorax sp.]
MHLLIFMPTIHRSADWKICLYAADHLPPHFHVVLRDGREALVEISTLAAIRGGISRRLLSDALAWAAENRSELERKWQELNP